jgi:hypothetical protein
MFKSRFIPALAGIVLLAMVSCVLGWSSSRAASLCLSNVTEVNPLLPEADVSGIIYYENNFVSVSSNGKGLYSPDGSDWVETTITTSGNIFGLAANTTRAIAVGTSGLTYVTTNGKTWTDGSEVNGGNNTLNAIIWTGSQWVVVGNNGELDTSPDGVTWTNHPSGESDVPLNAITFTGFSYVAVGGNGTIATSTDSINWVTHSSPTIGTGVNLTGVAYNPNPGNQILVVVTDTGVVFSSVDQGNTWSLVPNVPVDFDNWQKVRWFQNPGLFVAVGLGDSIMTSPDGLNWTLATSDTVPAVVNVVYELFDVAATPSGSQAVASGADTMIFNSTDFATWRQKYEGVYPNLNGIDFLGNFTSIASDGMLNIVQVGTDPQGAHDCIATYSLDGGGTFAPTYMPPVNYSGAADAAFPPYDKQPIQTFNPTAVTYSTTLAAYAAVGQDNAVEMSRDGGNTWTVTLTYQNAKHEEPQLNGITWVGDRFVMVGNTPNPTTNPPDVSLGNIQSSRDGINWLGIGQGVTSENMLGVASNQQGRVVAVGLSGEIAVTSDNDDGNESQWVGQELTGLPQLNSVAYGNGLWIVVGDNATAYVAPDVTNSDGTLTWTVNGIGGATGDINSIIFSNGIFYAFLANGMIYMTIDTTSWLPCVGPEAANVGLTSGTGTTEGVAILSAGSNTFVGSPPASVPSVVITKQPRDTSGVVGKAFSLSALGLSKSGATSYPVFYQWLQNGIDLINGGNVINSNESTLTINPTKSTSAGNYSVVVSNGLESVTSRIAKVTVFFPPAVTLQPVSQHVLSGSELILTVQASGSPLLRYQWLWKGKPLVNNSVVKGATSPTLRILVTQPKRSGSYQCKITSPYGTVLSSVVTVKMG